MTPLLPRALVSLALASLALGGVSALEVSAPGGVRPLAPLFQSDGLAFQQTWLVSAPSTSSSSADHVRALHVAAVARVAVEFAAELPLLDGADALAVVVVYGDSPAAVELVEPRTNGTDGALAVGVKNQDAAVQGRLFTQVFVREAGQLRDLSLSSSAQVVVGNGVLAPDSVALSNQGSGSIGVKLGEVLAVDSLSVDVSGSGAVHVKTPTLQAAKLSTTVTGSGGVKLYAREVHVPRIDAVVLGSGDFEVKNNDRPVSTCASEFVQVEGSGSAKTGAIVCDSVAVSIAGSGSALVQASRELSVDVSGSGHVGYVNSLPPQVKVTGGFPGLRSKTLKHKASKEYAYKDKYGFKTVKHKAQRVTVTVESSPNGEPKVTCWSPDAAVATIEKLEADPSVADAARFFTNMSLSDASSLLLPSYAAAGAAFVLVAAAAALRFRRHQGRGYHAIS